MDRVAHSDPRWTRWQHGQEARCCHASARRSGTRGCRCSPAVAEVGEEDEAEPVRGSPELELQRRGSATGAKNIGGLRAKEDARKLGRVGRRCGGGWGSLGIYIGGRGSAGEAAMGSNRWH
jgi:hypothetical protein